jgi:hypothetical protein
MHDLTAALAAELAVRMARFPALPPAELTIGIEHDGLLWATRSRSERSVTLKYDHHPHLLEIVVDPARTLDGIVGDLGWAWSRLDELAEQYEVLLDRAPTITDRPGLVSPQPAMAALRA